MRRPQKNRKLNNLKETNMYKLRTIDNQISTKCGAFLSESAAGPESVPELKTRIESAVGFQVDLKVDNEKQEILVRRVLRD